MDADALQIELEALIVAALARVHGKADLESLDKFIKLNWPKHHEAFMKTLAEKQ